MKRLRASSNVEEDMEEMRMEGELFKYYYWKIPLSLFFCSRLCSSIIDPRFCCRLIRTVLVYEIDVPSFLCLRYMMRCPSYFFNYSYSC